MSWRKTRKEMHKVRKKFSLMVNILGLVAIILIALLCLKMCSNNKYYSIKSRTREVEKNRIIKNSDYKTIAWLRVQGTKIDMPIIWSKSENEEFPVELENYAWSRNSDEKFHNKIDIMGHNIFNLSSTPRIKSSDFHRMEELMAFVYYDFAKNNEYIQLTIDGKDYLYKVYAVEFLSESSSTFLSPDEDLKGKDVIEEAKFHKDRSIYDYDVDIKENDKLISLSTCTRFYGLDGETLFYVNGRLVRDGEKINKYKVSKNKSYKKVEKKLKGDEKNEENNL